MAKFASKTSLYIQVFLTVRSNGDCSLFLVASSFSGIGIGIGIKTGTMVMAGKASESFESAEITFGPWQNHFEKVMTIAYFCLSVRQLKPSPVWPRPLLEPFSSNSIGL